LQTFSSLQSISIAFSSCEGVSDKGVISLSQALTFLVSIKSISLIFSNCLRVTDKGINRLSQDLKSLKALESLSLFLFGSGVTKNGKENIMQSARLLNLDMGKIDF